MIEQLIKLSNSLDAKGFESEADAIDLIITKIANEDYHFGFGQDDLVDLLDKPKEELEFSKEEDIFNAIEGIITSIEMAKDDNSPLEVLIPYIYEQIKPFLSEETLSEE